MSGYAVLTRPTILIDKVAVVELADDSGVDRGSTLKFPAECLWPVRTATVVGPIGLLEGLDEPRHEQRRALLRQCDTQKFDTGLGSHLTHVMGETNVASEAKIVVLGHLAIKRHVSDTFVSDAIN